MVSGIELIRFYGDSTGRHLDILIAAATLLPLKGRLVSYDKKFAIISNLQGTFVVPIEFFSNIKKIAVGSDIELTLDAKQNERVEFTPPTVIQVQK